MEKILASIKHKKISLKNSPCDLFFEKKIWASQNYLCGIDEVGRGCLAGPVITAAVILHPFAHHELLKDSKILTEQQRVTAANWIIKNSWYSFGIESAQSIDRFNIHKATNRAMKQALFGLLSQSLERAEKTKLVLVDAMPLKTFSTYPDLTILSFPFGESRSISIAAASILAKTKRDALLKRLHIRFNQYSLQENKGYGTKLHLEALKAYGPSIIHRSTFIKGIVDESDKSGKNNQTSLFC